MFHGPGLPRGRTSLANPTTAVVSLAVGLKHACKSWIHGIRIRTRAPAQCQWLFVGEYQLDSQVPKVAHDLLVLSLSAANNTWLIDQLENNRCFDKIFYFYPCKQDMSRVLHGVKELQGTKVDIYEAYVDKGQIVIPHTPGDDIFEVFENRHLPRLQLMLVS